MNFAIHYLLNVHHPPHRIKFTVDFNQFAKNIIAILCFLLDFFVILELQDRLLCCAQRVCALRNFLSIHQGNLRLAVHFIPSLDC
jgi:hypothetical protein